MSEPARKLRLVRTPPPGYTPLQLLIHHTLRAEGAIEEGLEALGPNLSALNELQDDLVEVITALQELRERAIVLAYTRGELQFRAREAPRAT